MRRSTLERAHACAASRARRARVSRNAAFSCIAPGDAARSGGVLALIAALGTALAGCAATRPMHTHDDGYAGISRDERRIDEERALLLAVPPEECAAACRSVGVICDASGRICDIARGLGEPDALGRCERARDACRRARAHVAETCACARAPGPDEDGHGGDGAP
jgi:hypothetical protein